MGIGFHLGKLGINVSYKSTLRETVAHNSVVRRTLRRYPGLPVALLGVALLAYDALFVLQNADTEPIDGVIAAAIALMAAAMLFGSYEIGRRGLTPLEGIQIFGFTLVAGLTGFLSASMLIAYQLLRGVPLVNVVLLIVTASATTASLGVWLALYYFDVQAKTNELLGQRNQVSSLNKRLTILQRVLRHNLRNEMAIIQGHTETMLEDADSNGQTHSLEVVLEHTKNLESLSDDAHRLRQIWNQDETIEMDAVDVIRTVVDAVEEDEPEADIETTLPESAHAVVHPQFTQAVEEAVTNAIRHNDPTTVDIQVTVERLDDSDVEIRVSDTGSGTPAFEWETLQQAEELPLKHGTGLGLWLIYWLVEKSGGELLYESNVPHGTIVRMQLPGADEAAEATEESRTAEFGHSSRRGW